ncbi:hypothetical protein RRF57_009753 [Xylaria bambusicola]|uniref:Uncharacterized protein n=1 Tax=Xylaria bambusicola TaxID=326684 RepID=A0AAN7V2Y3_9PEZI
MAINPNTKSQKLKATKPSEIEMATVPQTTNLKRKSSRWQNLPAPGDENSPDIEVDTSRYSLLLFLRDLSEPEEMERIHRSVTQYTSIAAQLLEAVEKLSKIDQDYINPEAPDAKKRRLDVLGNSAAGDTLAEYSELIHLARTLWTNPDELTDIIGDLYRRNLGQNFGDKNYSLDELVHMARSWGEVRYRFMNMLCAMIRTWGQRITRAGNAANEIVHESNVLLDSKLVEFRVGNGIGYNAQDRGIFEQTYLLTPEEGREILDYSGQNTGLRIGLPQVFTYIAGFINALVNWRVRVLEASRKQALSSQAYRQAQGYANRQAVLNARHASNHQGLSSVDAQYANDLIPTIRSLLEEARTQNAFYKTTFDKLETTVRAMIPAVRNSPMNRVSPELTRNVQFTTMLRAFPGPITLIRPTGTSIVNVRRAPRNRGRN